VFFNIELDLVATKINKIKLISQIEIIYFLIIFFLFYMKYPAKIIAVIWIRKSNSDSF